LREGAAQALVHQRNLAPFTSIRDLIHRVPELRKDELNTLAQIGALNEIGNSPRRHRDTENPKKLNQEFMPTAQSATEHSKSEIPSVSPCLRGEFAFHRRDALWQIERALRHSGPLLDELPEPDANSPLRPMNQEERLVADFRGTGMTVGPHPMAYHRTRMEAMGIHKASELSRIPDGQHLRIGGCVICRQRPGTAKGFVFLSIEDETGVANAIVTPDLFQKNRLLLSSAQFLMVEGILQNQDNVISVKAERVLPLSITQFARFLLTAIDKINVSKRLNLSTFAPTRSLLIYHYYILTHAVCGVFIRQGRQDAANHKLIKLMDLAVL
jgi:error-prone DNA polymerase